VFDVLVVGGGATGSGIALDAATRGLSVALVERGDFASETSSRSTKLVWAGIRYLGTAVAALLSRKLLTRPVETLKEFRSEFAMVLHCHRERHYMASKQKHLVTWVPIATPIRSWKMDPPPMGHPLFAYFPLFAPLVFKFYDMLSYFQCPASFVLTPEQARRAFPQLSIRGERQADNVPELQPLSGGRGRNGGAPPPVPPPRPPPPPLKYCAVFYEAMHNDARTNLAIAMSAAERGAAVANYVKAVGVLKEKEQGSLKAVGVTVQDVLTGETWNVQARKIVLAAGPFTDDVRRLDLDNSSSASNSSASASQSVVQGSAGTHIVVPGYFLPKTTGLGMLDPMTSDGRFLFILPFLGHTLIGTTDRKGPAVSLPAPPEADIDWILKECQTHLGMCVRRNQVLSAWTGWRPLAKDPNVKAEDGPISRDHVISENPETGVFFVAGGKWTTWRQMAEEVVDRIVGPRGPPSRTLTIKLHGGEGYSDDLPYRLLQAFPAMTEDVALHLARTYGSRCWEVCELCEPSCGTPLWPQFGRLIVSGFPYIDAEVRYACREYAMTIEDVLSRRTRLAFLNKKAAVSAIPVVADIMAELLGWSLKEKRQQMLTARLYLESYGGSIPQTADVLLREASQESPQRLFATLDRDGSGYIDYEEVSEAVGILGLKLSEEQVEQVFDRMDGSGQGRVSAEDFAAWWEKFRTSKAFEQMMASLDQKNSGNEPG
jgi:glycerol-3-phosphate dehydrogenase